MKTAAKLLLLISLTATFAVAQISQGTFKHIIIVVQENRTPDNLFGAAPSQARCGVEDPFENGVDIWNGGYANKIGQEVCNQSLPLSSWDADTGVQRIIDPNHSYENGWAPDYRSGHVDGFCHEYGNSNWPHPCPSYSYVQKSDVQPYFDIATNYGFANYMFQTNEGPSYEAHQFLFTGTSAPTAPHDSNNYYLDFVADLTSSSDYGCPYSVTGPKWVHPDRTVFGMNSYPECYSHDSLVTAAADCNGGNNPCDKGFSWGYYLPLDRAIWDAPSSIPEVCYGQNNTNNVGSACTSSEWTNHVHLAGATPYSGAPIFDDLYKCNLPQISWVIPDFVWSDHPQDGGNASTSVYGPSWVGDIIDAVGGGMQGSACNPLSSTNAKYWVQEPTAIFVVWDDWGGWFDHVAPWAYYTGQYQNGVYSCSSTNNAPNGWGCGYTSGFRVPLLVVSPYTGTYNQQAQTYSGYVSGACGASPLPSCPNNVYPYVHDFGSILAFTEWNFKFNPQFIDGPDKGYSDYNAPDWDANHTIPPLSDFFGLSQTRSFMSITTSEPFSFFQQYYQNGGTPTGPDDDADSD